MVRESNQASAYLLFAAAGTAALGGLLFGFDIAIITGAGPFLKERFHLDDLNLGWAFSSLLFGCVLGSLLAGRITDRYGRKSILVWVAALFAATSVLTGLAPNFPFFIAARLLGGLAVGAVSILSPIYIAEISPPASRGRMSALYQMAIVTGILLSYLTNYWLRNAGTENWRWMFATGAAPAVLLLVLLIRVPETPRYLALSGRYEQARAVLERLLGEEEAAREFAEIRLTLAGRTHTLRDLLRPGIRRAIVVSFFLGILIHVSGVNTVIDYAPAIFQEAGWKINAALFATFFVGLTNFVFTISSFWMIDRLGRKPLYIGGSLGMGATLAAIALLSLSGHFEGAWVPALVMTYLAFFAACIGPVFWTLVPEIFPNTMRGTAMSVPVLTQWTTNALVVLLFPFAFYRIGKAWTFAFLAVMCFVQAVFTWRFVPETKNRTLEQIESFWMDKNN